MDGAYLARLPYFGRWHLCYQCKTVNNSTAAHIVTNFKRKGRAGKHEETQADHQQRVKKREDNTNGGSFGTERNIMDFRRLKPGQKRMKSFGSSSGFTQQMPFG